MKVMIDLQFVTLAETLLGTMKPFIHTLSPALRWGQSLPSLRSDALWWNSSKRNKATRHLAQEDRKAKLDSASSHGLTRTLSISSCSRCWRWWFVSSFLLSLACLEVWLVVDPRAEPVSAYWYPTLSGPLPCSRSTRRALIRCLPWWIIQ